MLASVFESNGVVTLQGDATDDYISMFANAAQTEFSVSINGDASLTQTFQNADVSKVVVYAGGGDDEVRNTLVIPTVVYGGAGNDLIWGGYGDDQLYGGVGDDTMRGRSGNDLLNGYDGDDTLLGEDGDDTLYGARGDDYLRGWSGDDYLSGYEGNDTLLGDDGDDTVYGGNGNDQIYGHGGDDTLVGNVGHDTLRGGNGSDLLRGDDGNDDIRGDDGDDELRGGAGNDTERGGEGDDTVIGDAGDDLLDGDAGNDLIYGGDGIDRLLGENGNDALYGQAGEDKLYGGDGNDRLDGGADRDILSGQNGDDLLMGQDGHDYLTGDDGNDRLYGQGGSDTLLGQAGDDILDAGFDDMQDRLTGGTGWDQFIVLGDIGDGSVDVVNDRAGFETYNGYEGHLTALAEVSGSVLNVRAMPGGDDIRIRALDAQTRFLITSQDWTIGAWSTSAITELVVQGSAGHDRIQNYDSYVAMRVDGGDGNDRIWGGLSSDDLFGGNGHDTINGGPGDDFIRGGEGNDHIRGYLGNDRLSGNEGSDYIYGQEGDDEINAGGGSDRAWGGSGNDFVGGNEGNDELHGESGNDTLRGGAGDDQLYGGEGNDYLNGDNAQDALFGDAGADQLWGSDGIDTFFVDDQDNVHDRANDETVDGSTAEEDSENESPLADLLALFGNNVNETASQADFLAAASEFGTPDMFGNVTALTYGTSQLVFRNTADNSNGADTPVEFVGAIPTTVSPNFVVDLAEFTQSGTTTYVRPAPDGGLSVVIVDSDGVASSFGEIGDATSGALLDLVDITPEESPDFFDGGGSPDVSDVVDVLEDDTVEVPDRDILLVIDGTGSAEWNYNADVFPDGEARTQSDGRWLSHLRNFEEEYGDDDGDAHFYLNGPNTFATNVSTKVTQGYDFLNREYWNAIDEGLVPKIDILGMSRGGLIGHLIAWKIQREGFQRVHVPGNEVNNLRAGEIDRWIEIRFMGLYDPVHETVYTGHFNPPRAIPFIVKFAAAGYATNFSGNFETEVSRYYWDRMHFRGVSVPDEFFAATHSAIQGAPTYSSDPGGYAQEALALFDISDTPDDWLDGYTPAADIEGSEAFDRWMRDLAQSQGVPIPDVADYQFENLVDEDQGGEQFGT